MEAALHRELAEELGARAAAASQVFLVSSQSEDGVSVQHFFVATLARLDESTRTGAEFDDRSRGSYDLDRVELHAGALTELDLKPAALKAFILANWPALVSEAARHR